MSTPLFSLCHATRRLDQWLKTAQTWLKQATDPASLQYCVGVDQKDFAKLWGPDLMGLQRACGSIRCAYGSDALPDSAGKAWNAAVHLSTGAFLICVADDLTPPPHWDTHILKRVDFRNEVALKVDLSGDHGLMTFPFITRPYLERLTRDHGYQGGIWYPEYFGMRADDDFTACAQMDGVIVDATDLKFTHLHPTYGTAEWDDTYRWQHRSDAFELGDRVLERRRREGFKL